MTEQDFEAMMCRAAKLRARVELFDGLTGILVYWPGKNRATRSDRARPLRHGDPLQAGVRLDGMHESRVIAVPCQYVTGLVDA